MTLTRGGEYKTHGVKTFWLPFMGDHKLLGTFYEDHKILIHHNGGIAKIQARLIGV